MLKFTSNIFFSILTILKIVVISRFTNRKVWKKCINTNNDECIILGNGPSLHGVLRNYAQILKNMTLLTVNGFPLSDYYKKMKPKYHVIIAPELFMEDVRKSSKEKSRLLYKSICDNTDWKLVLFLPFLARKDKRWSNLMQINSNITICYFNTTPIEGLWFFNRMFFNFQLGLQRSNNVFTPSLMIAIWMKYTKLLLLGVDHSWLKEIHVNNKNEVLIAQKHFYNIDEIAKPMHKGGKGRRKLHEVLIKCVYAFRSYEIIAKYAKDQKVSIINLTEDSYIDSFRRNNIERELLKKSQ